MNESIVSHNNSSNDRNTNPSHNMSVSNNDDDNERKEWNRLRDYLASKGNNNNTTSNMDDDNSNNKYNDDESESDNNSDDLCIPIYHAIDETKNNADTAVKNKQPVYIDEDAIYDCFQLAIKSHNNNNNSNNINYDWHPKTKQLSPLNDNNDNDDYTNNGMSNSDDATGRTSTNSVVTSIHTESDVMLLQSWDPKLLQMVPSWALNLTKSK